MLSAFSQTRRTQRAEMSSAGAWRTITRAILKSKITKLAAAAVIILAVLVGIPNLPKQPSIVAKALAEVLDNMQHVPWVYVIWAQTDESPEEGDEFWVGFEQEIYIAKYRKGKIEYSDYRKQIYYVYDPATETLHISALEEQLPGHPLAIYLDSLETVKKHVQEGAEVTESKATYMGQTVDVYEISRGNTAGEK
ncbi:unnamed protein product, partial [marine sediment metagenome]